MQIGNFKALMSAEVDALDGAGNPVEVKLIKDGSMGGTKVFFQMIGSGCVSLYRGKHSNGVLTNVDNFIIDHMAERLAKNHDISALEGKLIRNLERLKEFDRLGWFDGDKVYRVDFNPKMELHRVNQSLLPPAKVVEEVLGLHSPSQKG